MSSRAEKSFIGLRQLSSHGHKNNRPKTQPSSQPDHEHYHRLNSELMTETEKTEDWLGAEG